MVIVTISTKIENFVKPVALEFVKIFLKIEQVKVFSIGVNNLPNFVVNFGGSKNTKL